MTHKFDLTIEGWLPCVMHDGRLEDLSLAEALTRAAEVRELFDESPLVTVALHRLLLAILHRNFGPPTFKAWQTLWQAGKWDGEKLGAYFEEWQRRRRFDLFDAERPFYQVREMNDVEPHPAARLKQEAATGNNATLFDHSFSDAPAAMTPGEAARFLVACQAFSIGGGKTGGHPPNFRSAPLTSGISILVMGNNLFETLALNLIVHSQERSFPVSDTDMPVWEQDAPTQPKNEGTPVRGYLDYMTWQSRRIHLIPEGEPTVVRRCQVQQSLWLTESPIVFDLFKCYLLDKDKGYRSLPLNTSKALWRDSHTLFQQSAPATDKAVERPKVFNHLAQINRARDDGAIESRPTYAFAAYGFATDPGKAASVLMWSREHLPLPLGYLEDDDGLIARLGEAINLANDIGKTLQDAVRHLAKLLLAPASNAASARQPDKNDIAKLADSFPTAQLYWSRLETRFKTLLIALPDDLRLGEGGMKHYGGATLPEWARTLERTARAAFDETTRSFDSSARNLKAVAIAGQQFEKTLSARVKEFLSRDLTAVTP